MLVREWELVFRHAEDGGDEHIVIPEKYRFDVALFLIFDPNRGLLFERRKGIADVLRNEFVIPGGKFADPGERKNPFWAARAECVEETRAVPRRWVPLETVFDHVQRIMLYPFLMNVWDSVVNTEPKKRTFHWFGLREVYKGEGMFTRIHPMFRVSTTRRILLDAGRKLREGFL